MKRLEQKHLRAVRWFHWINFPLLALMIFSGILIYWAYDPYRLGWGDTTVLHFFPDGFYEFLHLKYRLAEGMSLHFVFMWLFAVNGIAYVLYTLFSGEWRYLKPDRNAFKDSIAVTLYELRIRKTQPPYVKYNAAQRMTYSLIIVMGGLSLLTGLAIYKPVQLWWLCGALGGYRAARVEHFVLMIGYVLFFLLHVVQVIRAGWPNFRSMITGYDVATVQEVAAGTVSAESNPIEDPADGQH